MKKKLPLFLILVLTFIGCEDVNSDRYIDSKIQTSTNDIAFPSIKSGSVTFTLTVSDKWVINPSDTKGAPDWLSVTPFSGGAGTTLITVTINRDNNTINDRTGYLKIHSGGLTKIIPVTQPGNAPIVLDVKSAGTLGSMLTETQKNNITHVKLTGKINAADFQVMRDGMPILESVDLSDVTVDKNRIPDFAFSYQDQPDHELYVGKPTLKQLLLPQTITEIGDYAFSCCAALWGSLIIPEGVTSIGHGAFARCSKLNGSLTFPNSLISIGDMAFMNCDGFKGSLSIQNGVKTIGEKAFSGCPEFTGTLIIPTSVTSIGSGAFANCINFTGPLSIPGSVEVIQDEAFYRFGTDVNLIISEGVKVIKSRAFSNSVGSKGLLTIPLSVTSIGEEAFSSCTGFTGMLSIPGSVVSIGKRAFADCPGFSGSLILSDGIEIIEENAFAGSSGFSGALVIPSSVTLIGERAFGALGGIDKVRVSWATPILYFDYMIPNRLVEVPLASLELYKAARGWKNHNLIGY